MIFIATIRFFLVRSETRAQPRVLSWRGVSCVRIYKDFEYLGVNQQMCTQFQLNFYCDRDCDATEYNFVIMQLGIN